MFNRANNYFIVTTNNLKALEAVSECIYSGLKERYLIQIEQFPNNLTIYHIYIPIREDQDKKVKKKIMDYLELKHTKLLEEEP
jgi:hypothetical protein